MRRVVDREAILIDDDHARWIRKSGANKNLLALKGKNVCCTRREEQKSLSSMTFISLGSLKANLIQLYFMRELMQK